MKKTLFNGAILVTTLLAMGSTAHASISRIPDTATTSLLFAGSAMTLGFLRRFIKR